jgi:hypothetical protein
VHYSTRRKNRRALFGDELFPTNCPFVVAFENLECLVLALMDVRWRAAARHVVRFNHAHHATGVAPVDADDHRDAQNVHFPATVRSDLNWIHEND